MVPVGLLEPCEVRASTRRMPIEKLDPVLPVVGFPIGNHVWQGESLRPATEFVLCFLFLFNFLREKHKELSPGEGEDDGDTVGLSPAVPGVLKDVLTLGTLLSHAQRTFWAQCGGQEAAGTVAQAASTGSEAMETSPARPPTLSPEQSPRERLVELHTSFRELLTFFCTNTTIHGTIRLVCSSPNRLKKVSWGLLLLGTLGVLYWQLGLLLEQYWRYPVLMAVSVHSESKIFPSVTVCDMNPQRPRALRHRLEALDAFAQESIYSLYKFNFSEGRDSPFSNVPGPEPLFQLDCGIRLQQLRDLGSQHKVGFRLCNSTGGDCFYRTYSSGVKAAQEWYHFHYMDILGLVPTAGGDSHQSRFVLSCHYDSEDCQAQHFRTWHPPTYGSCYTFEGVFAAQRPGVTHKISLVLRTQTQVVLPLLSTEPDIKVMIHGHNHTPFLEPRGFSIRPGLETTIGIREGDFLQALRHDLPVAFRQVSCHCFYRLLQALEAHRLSCDSRCPRPCRETSYKLSATTSRWPSAKSADWIFAVLEEQTQSPSLSPGRRWAPPSPGRSRTPRSHMAKVNIFYQELNYRMVDEAPVYSVPQLLSAMGSLWSLWFGSSVLSIVELLELLLDATALTLLLGFRQLWGTQVSQPGASSASGSACTSPGARDSRPRVPVGALERVLVEELG
ncbi:Amiloride-sensitive sodium channel subunit delta [Heterocephalus glaber]|uniref:Amiloride-sensitive sodium channel subunit delta n=1 Tax=Heterocephalus glaber TaxID=10181 RepID=G5ATQ8_HETGA|nr:Amiloride-sensitive sodium channel subunit delta [Heterocephalus glaber]